MKSVTDRLADALTCLLNDWRAYRDIPRRTSDGLEDQAVKALEAYRREQGEGAEVEPESPKGVRPMAESHRWTDGDTAFIVQRKSAPPTATGIGLRLVIDELLRVVAERDRLSHRLELINGERESLFAETVELRTRERALGAVRVELQAQVEGLEAQRDHYRVAVSKLQQRLSRLDAMLAREAVPNGLWSAVAQWPCLDHGRIVTGAWNWFRETFGPSSETKPAPDPTPEDVQGEPEGSAENRSARRKS